MTWTLCGLLLGLLVLAMAALVHIIVDDRKHKDDWKPPM